MSDKITMVLPCDCPYTGQPMIIKIEMPYPEIQVFTPETAPDEIKNVILNQNDHPQDLEAA